MHDRDPVRQAHGLGLVVGDVDRRGAGLAQHALQLRAHFEAQQRVEVGQRLVHQQHGGLDGERAGHGDALALPARELGGIAVEIGLDVQERRRRCGPCGRTCSCGFFCMRRPNATFS